MKPTYELVLLLFDDEHRAVEVLHTLKDVERQGRARLFNAAILEKDPAGKTHVHETQDVSAGKGALFGAIVGGLIGLLGGPGGAIVGAAAGAATGGVAADRLDMGFSDDFMHQLEESLKPGSSAFVALLEPEWAERTLAEMQPLGGRMLRHALKSDLAARLAEVRSETDPGNLPDTKT
ncbi:MAG TPA: DUF1269 domain-containing protein [Anaerolineales bacterium]